MIEPDGIHHWSKPRRDDSNAAALASCGSMRVRRPDSWGPERSEELSLGLTGMALRRLRGTSA
jgi:hypothetical protein